ncbi:hypothetical protein C1280_16380 [Gemmata obscuriglobus]|uniref:Uncharacterized protein n=1 Tax=Gemmata obscuriglobus TaxID=114 RepID=A0A2Z3HB26_9BACT
MTRVESLLWLYYVVELVGALVEREVRPAMTNDGIESLALYPEGRATLAPTTGAVFDVLEGQRRHRLVEASGQELRRFHDPCPTTPAACSTCSGSVRRRTESMTRN